MIKIIKNQIVIYTLVMISMFFSGCNNIEIPDFKKLTQNEIQRNCVGKVINVEEATIQSEWGKIIGAIVGGVIGNQFGGGTGNNVSTVGGIVAGGFIGNQFDNAKNAQLLLIEINNIKVSVLVKKKERLFEVGDKVEFKLVNNEIIDVLLANEKKLGCSEFKKSKNAIMCNDLTRAGSNKKESHQVYLGNSFGEFDLEYETFTAKDRILVKYDNQTLFDTGCIGTKGKLKKKLQYNGLSEEMTIEVIPNCVGNEPSTKWNFKLICNSESQTKKISDYKTEIIVRGVMTDRKYLDTKKIWEYKIEQLDTNTYFSFTSKNKLLYKDDLIEMKVVNGIVDDKKIKILKKSYYKFKNKTEIKKSNNLSKTDNKNNQEIQKQEIQKSNNSPITDNKEKDLKEITKESNQNSVDKLFGDDEDLSTGKDSQSVEELF